jgi:cytochrome c-type biogenesis protein CcmH/NrfG
MRSRDRVLADRKNLPDSEALLRRATQLAPDYAAAWLILGAVQLEQQKFLDAIRSYEKVTELEPRDPRAWAGLGSAHARAGYADRSAVAYAKAVALKPDAPAVQMGYAHVLKTLGDQTGALAAYRAR